MIRTSLIEHILKNELKSLEILLDGYKCIRKGDWLLNRSAFDFFMGEVEFMLEAKLNSPELNKMKVEYEELKKQEAPYLKTLLYADFLNREVVSRTKEMLKFSTVTQESSMNRLFAFEKDEVCLVSYCRLPDFLNNQTYYGGICWDINVLKNETLPGILNEETNKTGLNFQILDVDNLKSVEQGNSFDHASVILSFRQYPLPWKLEVTQPAFNDLEKTAMRENLFYGVLFLCILVLMLFGVFLLARDIARESETTRLQTEFVHNISHELKTPLTLIRLYGETLQRKDNLDKEDRQEAYEIITKESERLSHLINNVLDFSRIEMGRKEFDVVPGNLAMVVKKTLESYRYHVERKGFSMGIELAPNLPVVHFDKEAITSVLINLLSNAVKFSQDQKEIKVRLYHKDKDVIIEVTDKGIGMTAKDIANIFNRFYRAKNRLVSETRGSGLGLTLARHIAEAHGGRINVKSEPGKGSVFSLVLPVHS
jgi:signal transduction histidine kinase